jgi:hypothetical protein
VNRQLAEGDLQALLDGALPAGERVTTEAHLAGCGECSALHRELRMVNARTRELLLGADVPAPVAQAQMSLRARRARRPAPWAGTRAALLRAAVLVLAVAGVASATVPGSPVRAWLRDTLIPAHPLAPAPQPQPQPAAPAAAPQNAAGPTGVSIRPRNGAVRVVLRDASPRLRITARLVDVERAGVLARGHAVETARFRTSPGRIEVVGAGPGEIEVEIPRGASIATLEVNGRIYVGKEGDSLRVLAPEADAGGAPEVRVGG